MKTGKYSPEEVQFIQTHYPLKGAKWIAKELDRSHKAIQRKASELGLKYQRPWERSDLDLTICCDKLTGQMRLAVASCATQVRQFLPPGGPNLFARKRDLDEMPSYGLQAVKQRCRRLCGNGFPDCPWRERRDGHVIWWLTDDVAAVSRSNKKYHFTTQDRLERLFVEIRYERAARARNRQASTRSFHDFVCGVTWHWYRDQFPAGSVDLDEYCSNGWDLLFREQQLGQAPLWWGIEVKTGLKPDLRKAVSQLLGYVAKEPRPVKPVLVVPSYRQPHGGFPPEITVVTFSQIGIPPDLAGKWD